MKPFKWWMYLAMPIVLIFNIVKVIIFGILSIPIIIALISTEWTATTFKTEKPKFYYYLEDVFLKF